MWFLVLVFAIVFGTGPALAQATGKESPDPVASPRTAAPKAAPKGTPKATPKTQPDKPKAAAKTDRRRSEPARDARTKTDRPKAAKAKSDATKSDKPKSDKPKSAARPKARGKPVVPRADAPATIGNAPAATASERRGIRDSYDALSLAERIAIQSDLVWTGDFNGTVNGEYSERLVAAVKAFQTRNKTRPTGVLNPQERAALAGSARPLRAEVGWRLIEDPATGIHFGIPARIATERASIPRGTLWSSAQGQLQIETFRMNDAGLEAIYELQKRQPAGRRVSYNVLRPDFFVVSGTQGLKKFYVRAAVKDGEVRGMTVLYDQAMAGTMDPVVVAMSSAFNPFPAPGASADGTPRRRDVEYATGLIVSARGHVVTDRQAVEGCRVIVLPGLGPAERISEDASANLALLRVNGVRNLSPVGLIGAAAPAGSNVAAVGIADPQAQGGAAAVTTAATRLASAAGAPVLDPPPPPGFTGAAVLDPQGRLIGVVMLRPSVVAGAANAPQAAVVSRERLVNFLEANFVPPASGATGVDAVRSSVVRVICVRR